MCERCGDDKCFGDKKFNKPVGSAERAVDIAYVIMGNTLDRAKADALIKLIGGLYALPLNSVIDMIKAKHKWYEDRHAKGLGVPDYYEELKDVY